MHLQVTGTPWAHVPWGKGTEAVVDNLLKVYGIENLRIADASVMPDITSASTNAPTMMIGEFVAKALLGN